MGVVLKYGGMGKGVIVAAGADTGGEEGDGDGDVSGGGLSSVGDSNLLFFFFFSIHGVSMRIRTDK